MEKKKTGDNQILVVDETMQKKYVENCTFVKTILMLFVVVYHCILFFAGGDWFSGYETTEPIQAVGFLANYLNSFHVYCFVFTSGYLFSYLLYEQGKYQKYSAFIVNKFKRLIVPYLFVSIIWAFPVGVYFFDYSINDFIERYMLGMSPSQLWFLLVLFFIFIIVWPISRVIEKNVFFALGLGLLFWGIGIIGSHLFHKDIFKIWTALQFVPYFIIGMYFRKLNRNGHIVLGNWLIKGSLLTTHILLFIYLRLCGSDISRIANIVLCLLMHCVGVIAVFYILQDVALIFKWKDSQVFGKLAKSSMVVYLFHQQLIYISIDIFNGIINPYIHMIVNVILSVLGSLIIAEIMMRNKYSKFLLGEK